MNEKRPGARLRLRIEKIVAGGEGLARHEGKVVFVPGALPGEEVLAEVVESKKDFARARLDRVLEASSDRVTPECPYYARCGGCDFMHLSHEAQGRHKAAYVADTLRRLARVDLPAIPIETGSPFRYRSRIQVQVDGRGRRGFMAKSSHEVVDIGHCPVAVPALDALFSPGSERGGEEGNASPGRSPAPRRPESPGRYLAFAHPSARPPLASESESGSAGSPIEVTLPLLGRDFVFPLPGFFQSNVEMLERLLPFALEGLEGGPSGSAFDLYSGVGVFAAFLEDRFGRILLAEENAQSLSYARRNLRGGAHLFLPGPVESLLQSPLAAPFLKEPPAAVVVDPPRTGLSPAVRKILLGLAPPRIRYVSCDPVTLARDLKDLLAGGYRLEALRLFDFYPQTSHVEAVARLERP